MKKGIRRFLSCVGRCLLNVITVLLIGTAFITAGLGFTTAKPEEAIHSLYHPVTPCTTAQYKQGRAHIEATFHIHLEQHWWGNTVTTIKGGEQTTVVGFFNRWVKIK